MTSARLLLRLLAAVGVSACSRSSPTTAPDPASSADPVAPPEPPNALCRPGLACVRGSLCQAHNPRGLEGPVHEECSCDEGGHFVCPSRRTDGPLLVCLPGACSPGEKAPLLSRRYAADCLFPVPDGSPGQTLSNGDGHPECCYRARMTSCEGRPLLIGGQARWATLVRATPRSSGW